jgi:peptidoglycan/xylan/chitin deacetylase (PgdA/CDA1 family)
VPLLRVAAVLATVFASGQLAQAADSAVILMYHHVADNTPASTSVSPDRFEAHLSYLEDNEFAVLPLLDVLQSLEAGRVLPERAVVITFDDGYQSVLTEALPRLRARGWPFTVFVSTQYVDERFGGYLSWDELRQLSQAGATIGNHSRSHAHLLRYEAGEDSKAWQARVRDEIASAGTRIQEQVGAAAIEVLAYPYGEYDAELAAIVRDMGLYGLGQHSGAAGRISGLQTLPRYPQAKGFDSDDDFALRVRSRPLPAVVTGNPQRVVAAGARPRVRLTLADGDYRIEQLACYASNQGRMELRHLNAADSRSIEIGPAQGLVPGRTKYNCTAPSASERGVYYWFSHLIMTKTPAGDWYRE